MRKIQLKQKGLMLQVERFHEKTRIFCFTKP